MEKYNPHKLMIKMSTKLKSIEDAIDDKTTGTINSVAKQGGVNLAEGILVGWLIHLNELLNLKTPMTEPQIEMATHMIIADYGTLKFSDLAVLFNQIIRGQHGEFYGTLGIDKIMKIFETYFDQRCEIGMNRSISKNTEIKQGLAEVSTKRNSNRF